MATQPKSQFELYNYHFCSGECYRKWIQENHSVEFECEFCGKSSKKINSLYKRYPHHFCSRECYGAWLRRQQAVFFKCETCGKESSLTLAKFKSKKHHFCSRSCWETWTHQQTFTEVKCAKCGKFFERERKCLERQNGAKNFCSRECYGQFNRGENNPRWKGGRAKENFENAFGVSVKEWQKLAKEIRNRDNYVCQNCKMTPAFVVHHIIPRYMGIDNQPQNLITLCTSCHSQVE